MARQLSNLPPGCSSPDGGIDHAWEKATDELLNVVDTPELAMALKEFAPVLSKLLNEEYQRGRRDGIEEADWGAAAEAPDIPVGSAVPKSQLQKGKRVRVVFKGKGQRVQRVMTVDYIGEDAINQRHAFSGRPQFGTVYVPWDEVISFHKAVGRHISEPRKVRR